MLSVTLFRLRLSLLLLSGVSTLLIAPVPDTAPYMLSVLGLMFLVILRDNWFPRSWTPLSLCFELAADGFICWNYGGLFPLLFVSSLISLFQNGRSSARIPLTALTFVVLNVAARNGHVETLLLSDAFFAASAYLLFSSQKLSVGKEELQRLYDELRKKHYELDEARERMREYARKVETLSQAEERNRIAHDIHDDLGHKLIRLKMMLEASLHLLPSHVGKASDMLRQVRDQLGDSMETMRTTVRRLKPDESVVRSFSLDALIEDVKSDGSLRISFETKGTPIFMYPSAEVVLYRNAQEAITNAVRHGGATEIAVTVEYGDSETVLTVSNNGSIPGGSARKGLGLSGMEERTVLLGGKVNVQYEPLFTISTIIPVQQ